MIQPFFSKFKIFKWLRSFLGRPSNFRKLSFLNRRLIFSDKVCDRFLCIIFTQFNLPYFRQKLTRETYGTHLLQLIFSQHLNRTLTRDERTRKLFENMFANLFLFANKNRTWKNFDIENKNRTRTKTLKSRTLFFE